MTTKDFVKKYKLFIIILALIPIITILVFAILEYALHKIDMKAAEWAAFIGTILGYLGTVFLGILALWQNEKANYINQQISDSQLKKDYHTTLLPCWLFLIESNCNGEIQMNHSNREFLIAKWDYQMQFAFKITDQYSIKCIKLNKLTFCNAENSTFYYLMEKPYIDKFPLSRTIGGNNDELSIVVIATGITFNVYHYEVDCNDNEAFKPTIANILGIQAELELTNIFDVVTKMSFVFHMKKEFYPDAYKYTLLNTDSMPLNIQIEDIYISKNTSDIKSN